jgi:flagellar motility protein MotE (MotC chaperone)
MPDDEAVRLLFAMKTDDASALLDTMSALGAPEAKRAATLTTRLHEVLPDPTNTISSTAP